MNGRAEKTIALCVVLTSVVAMAAAGASNVGAAPVKLVPGAKLQDGFAHPEGVAASPNGNIYVADLGNNRIQELKPNGEFVLMFGKEVNETTGGDVCTASSGDKCKEGTAGPGAGAFKEPESIAVDPASEDVYVQDIANWRVQQFTPNGEFVLMIGKDVNETTGGNICTAASGDTCKAGLRATVGSVEHGAFKFGQFAGDLLTVSNFPQHRLYVGDEHRVQEFDATTAEWKAEIQLAGINAEPATDVRALGLDPGGDLYLAYGGLSFSADHIYKFDDNGVAIGTFPIRQPETSSSVKVEALAIESLGRLAVVEKALGMQLANYGSLYDAATLGLITEFTVPAATSGIAFNSAGELYAVIPATNEVLVYHPVLVAELATSSATCKMGASIETSVTVKCALTGTVNTEEVPKTEAWFLWGARTLDRETPKRPIQTGNTPVLLEETIEGLRPNEAYDYRLDSTDQNTGSEVLASKTEEFTTSSVAPVAVGLPNATFVGASSAVMASELNPENAMTEYSFEYGPCKENKPSNCSASVYPAKTAKLASGVYGRTEAILEASGLLPETTYHYRLAAMNEKGEHSVGEKGETNAPEGVFTTAPAPRVQATTGLPNSLTATSAVGTGSVNPDGQPATVIFELGLYAGTETQYGRVSSTTVGATVVPIEEAVTFTGLQPGTQYSYRVKIESGYGVAVGAPVIFKTEGIPEVLSTPPPLAMLAVPATPFPKPVVKPVVKCKRGFKRNKRGKCAKAAEKTKQRHRSGARTRATGRGK